MRPPARYFLLSLAGVLCGPLLGYAPTARAGFVADRITPQPLTCAASPLAGLLSDSGLGADARAGSLGSSATSADMTAYPLPRPVPAKNGGHPPAQRLPVSSASGAGSAGGTPGGGSSGRRVSPMRATLPPSSSVGPEEKGVFLALREAPFLPSPFPSRPFKPPRQD